MNRDAWDGPAVSDHPVMATNGVGLADALGALRDIAQEVLGCVGELERLLAPLCEPEKLNVPSELTPVPSSGVPVLDDTAGIATLLQEATFRLRSVGRRLAL